MGNISKVNNQTMPQQSGAAPASATPAVSVSTGAFGVVTATITKSGGGTYRNPNYSAVAVDSEGTTTVADSAAIRSLESDLSHLSGTIVLNDTNASTAQRALTIKVQEFGENLDSAAATATYTPVAIQNNYVRIRGVDSSGSNSSDRLAIDDIKFYTGAGGAGTGYPESALTANDSNIDEEGVQVGAGHSYSSTYAAWRAVESNTTNQMWWALGTSAANNYWEINFSAEFEGFSEGAPAIKSMTIRFDTQTDASYFKVTGSNESDHSSATDYGTFEITAEDQQLAFG